MFGCASIASAWRSSSKRAITSRVPRPNLMILIATRRRTGARCSARNTSPIAPSPMRSSTVRDRCCRGIASGDIASRRASMPTAHRRGWRAGAARARRASARRKRRANARVAPRPTARHASNSACSASRFMAPTAAPSRSASQARANAQSRFAVAGETVERLARLPRCSCRRRTAGIPVPPAAAARPQAPSAQLDGEHVEVCTPAATSRPPRASRARARRRASPSRRLRAWSTRMRRIASAAAPKKWRRFSQAAPGARRRYASLTSAVGCRVWPAPRAAGSRQRRVAARHRPPRTGGHRPRGRRSRRLPAGA